MVSGLTQQRLAPLTASSTLNPSYGFWDTPFSVLLPLPSQSPALVLLPDSCTLHVGVFYRVLGPLPFPFFFFLSYATTVASRGCFKSHLHADSSRIVSGQISF